MSQSPDIHPTTTLEAGQEDKQKIQDPPFPDDIQKAETAPYRQDVFGDEEHAEIKYKTLKWWYGSLSTIPTETYYIKLIIFRACRQCGLLMVAETISLGILSLPAAVAGLGLAPAIIILISLGLIASYTGYVIGQLKWRYPHISSMADAGEVLMGKFGKEILFGGQILYLVFLMASHLLTFSVAMNTITVHGTCSIVFGIVGLVLSLGLSLPRTLKNMSWLSLACGSTWHRVSRSTELIGYSIHQYLHSGPPHNDRNRHTEPQAIHHSNRANKPRHRFYLSPQHLLVLRSVCSLHLHPLLETHS